jgi:AcrR family transcriptional regulator
LSASDGRARRLSRTSTTGSAATAAGPIAAGEVAPPGLSPAARTPKGERTRARLLSAAKHVFERQGFLGARVSDIADRAKISHGAFYHYFNSKEEIFRELAHAQEARLTAAAAFDHGDLGINSSPRVQVREGVRRYLAQYRTQARIMGVIEQVSRYDAEVNAARVASQRQFTKRAEEACRLQQRAGLADPMLDPVIAADALGAMVSRFAELWLVQGYRQYDFDEAVEQLSVICANALRHPEDADTKTDAEARQGRSTT